MGSIIGEIDCVGGRGCKTAPLTCVVVPVLPWSGDKVTEAAKTGLAVMKIKASESEVSNSAVEINFLLFIVILL